MVVALVVVLLVFALWMVFSYNSLVRLRNKCEESAAALDAHLKARYDLVPNLVEAVKGSTKHERGTLEAVMAARNQAAGAGGRAEAGLSAALGKVFALSEAYPELKANESFVTLQGQLMTLEEEILSARKYYNAIARAYNDKTMVFPTSILAGLFRFEKRPYLQAEEAEKQRVEVKF